MQYNKGRGKNCYEQKTSGLRPDGQEPAPGVFNRESCRQREQPAQSSKENKASVQRTGKPAWTENNG